MSNLQHKAEEIMPSQRYIFKSDDLWEQYQNNKIDHDKYISLLEEIKKEELKEYDDMPSTKETVERDIYSYENDRQLRMEEYKEYKEKEDRERAETERIQKLSPQERYKENLPAIIRQMRHEANRYRNISNRFQGIIIIGSILVTSFTSAIGYAEVFKLLSASISIIVGISASFTGYFKFKERSFNLQRTADALEQEYVAVELLIGSYKGKTPEEALILLAERAEFLKEEQKKREQQLEQPPEIKSGQG